ncbi:MAG: glycosyltransferase family 2 protein [Candidatus Rokuibacteriota bacterium]
MTDGRRARVGLVIPALDEEAAIGTVIQAVPAALVDDLIVVDNGSTDETALVARAAGARVIIEPRRGYGAACWAGVLALSPEVEVAAFLDGDGSQDPAELPRLLTPLEADCADLVLGVRGFGGAGSDHPRHAVLGTRAVATIVRWRFGVRLRDIGPFRAIRRSALLALNLRDRGYGWPVEMVVKAAHRGLRIAEVEVTQRPRLGGRSKVAGTFRGSLRAGWRFVQVALREGR